MLDQNARKFRVHLPTTAIERAVGGGKSNMMARFNSNLTAGSLWFFGRLRWVSKLLVEELAPRPRRLRTAMRMALIGTIGAGLMAIGHVQTALGAYIVWLMLGENAMMSFGRAIVYLAVTAPIVAAAVPLAGILSESPWLLLPFVGFITALSTYFVVTRKLDSFGLLLQVLVLDSFYGVVFAPREFGWAASAAVGACAITFGLVAAFDKIIWPDPAEAILLESLAGSITRQRNRFLLAARSFLDESAELPPEPHIISEMQAQLGLLNRAVAEGITAHRRAILLAQITRVQRLHLDVNLIAVVVRQNVSRIARRMVRTELDNACLAIAAAMDEIARDTLVEIRTGADQPPTPVAARVNQAIDTLDARITEVRPQYINLASGAEVANFGAFIEVLYRMRQLIGRPLDEPPPAAEQLAARQAKPAPGADPVMVRFSLKVGLSIVIGYVIGLVTQRADLSTILTTIIISGQPTYGAALRKMILRNIGAFLGGVVSLLAIIIATPNFNSVPSYMMVVFVVLLSSAYCSLSSGRVAYAGKQIGVTFLLVFAGLSPSPDIYSPLWRIWGILLGTFVVTIVFFLLWPEYAGDSLLPRLQKVVRDALALMPGGSATANESAIGRTENEIASVLSEILQVADDARVEGRRSLIDHQAVVHAAGTIRRISSWTAMMAKRRLGEPLPRMDDSAEDAHNATLSAMRQRFQEWLAFYQGGQCLNSRAARALAASHTYDQIARPLADFGELVEANGFARIASWTLDQRRQMLWELQALRRLEFLIRELDDFLSRVPGANPAALLLSTGRAAASEVA